MTGNVIPLRPALEPASPRIALLGTGTVGRAFVQRYVQLRERDLPLPELLLIANSRAQHGCQGDWLQVLDALASATDAGARAGFDDDLLRAGDIVVDATASEDVAAAHAGWLRRGLHVVTANKLGNGMALARAQEIVASARAGRSRYGDAATVGAGLPLLRSVRALVRGGDRIETMEGILSGSLAWLFNHYDGMRAFSRFVREARDGSFTEPDPRIDLSGEDVRRKLLILARAAGIALQVEQVQVESLVPPALAALELAELDAALPALDAGLRERFQRAWRDGERLRFVGRLQVDADGTVRADVGLRALPAEHPLCSGAGTDNKVAIGSSRYRQQPLVIQGPGAGAEITAAALLDDVLVISDPA